MAGHDVQEVEKAPIHMEGSEIEDVDSFAYLGFVVRLMLRLTGASQMHPRPLVPYTMPSSMTGT